ncbi:MAG: LemA family protein [Nanoarchaeota archaeon]|nr:MAG: LemA family protein [Nanoarchaeota archaeon]
MAKQANYTPWIIAGVAGAVILLIIFSVIGMYNSIVAKDVGVDKAWANVQSTYQRRADLIPNLVDTVKGAKNFEQQTLTQITQLRGEAVSASAKVQAATSADQITSANGEVSSVLSRLLVIVEAYPDIKSTQNFLALQDEIAGTENRINFARDNYNSAVQQYQVAVRIFPGNVVAGVFGFSADKHKPFAADQGAEKAPKVNFGQ